MILQIFSVNTNVNLFQLFWVVPLFILVWYGLRRRFKRRYIESWRYKILCMLESLQDRQYVELAKLLRIITAKTISAKASCLNGYEWLECLTHYDPQGFSWTEHGKQLLINNADFVEDPISDPSHFHNLVNAAKAWVN
jgi:hypothetical protein